MEAQARDRPILPAIWTEYQNLSGHPRTAFRTSGSTSPAFSASPMSSRSLPSPMYPPGAGYDTSMRRHERAMVDRLDRRHSVQLAPITEQQPSRQSQQDQSVILSPISQGSPGSSRGDISPRASALLRRRCTVVAETRSILLSGLPPLQSITNTSTINQPFTPQLQQDHHRRRSSSSLTTPTTATSAAARHRRDSLIVRQRLQEWGPVTYGNAKSADVFVAATGLRRPGSSASSVNTDDIKADPDAADDKTSPATANEGRMKLDGQLTVRARIRPHELERKPFVIQRSFDLEALRATVLDPAQLPPARRLSADAGRADPSVMRRRSAGAEAIGRAFMKSTNTMPMHIQYARAHLPVLAALMLSGHVRDKDTIDLPMPHPEAWQTTVAYIYTGQVEMTDAVKENILYLGGKA